MHWAEIMFSSIRGPVIPPEALYRQPFRRRKPHSSALSISNHQVTHRCLESRQYVFITGVGISFKGGRWSSKPPGQAKFP
jgi:hypothetical protein